MSAHILVVDDEPDVLFVLKSVLELESYAVTTASGGEAAKEMLSTDHFDILLTDLRMPGVTGLQLLEWVKTRRIPVEVIILTGYGTVENAVTALRQNTAFDFFIKPLEEPELLILAIEKALRQQKLERQKKGLLEQLKKRNRALALNNTELLDQRARLAESEARFCQMAENIKEVFWLMDWDKQKALYVSPAYETIWGRPLQRLYEGVDEWLESVHPDDRQSVLASFDTIRREGKALRRYRIIRPDKSMRWILDRGFSVKDRTGRGIRFAGISEDISEQVAAEANKQHLRNELFKTQKFEAIATLAGGVAHQFNNALAVISGNIEMIEMDGSGHWAVESNLHPIKAAVKRISCLTDQLLAYAQGGKYRPQIVDAHRFITDFLAVVDHLIQTPITFSAELDTSCGYINIDSAQMQMVLMALLQNACEALTGAGNITVALYPEVVTEQKSIRSQGLPTGEYVVITVTDDGCGMAPEPRRRLFEPFFTTKFQGRGLGLAAAYGIVKNHSGAIEVTSSPDEGTEMAVYLPLIQPVEAE